MDSIERDAILSEARATVERHRRDIIAEARKSVDGWTPPSPQTPPEPKPAPRPTVIAGISEAQLHEQSAELLNVVNALTEACEKAFEKQQADLRKLEVELAKAEARIMRLVSNTIAKLVPPASASSTNNVVEASPLSPQGRRIN